MFSCLVIFPNVEGWYKLLLLLLLVVVVVVVVFGGGGGGVVDSATDDIGGDDDGGGAADDAMILEFLHFQFFSLTAFTFALFMFQADNLLWSFWDV